MIPQISMRKVMAVPKEQLWDKIRGPKEHDGEIHVHYDDGYVKSNACELILTAYYLDLIVDTHNMPLLKKYHVTEYYKDGAFTPATTNDFFQEVLFDTQEFRGWQDDSIKTYSLAKKIMRYNNDIYNIGVVKTTRHMITLDVIHIIDATNNIELLKLKEECEAEGYTVKAVANAIKKAGEKIREGLYDPDGKLNPISWLVQRNLIKLSQVVQSIFIRGYVPDIDHEIVDHAIKPNLTESLHTVRDLGAISREGTVAVGANKKDLPKVSVKGREASYIGISKDNIVIGDCGSKEYVYYNLSEGGEDFRNLIGSPMLDESTNKIIRIKSTDKHLIGKTVLIRNPITCKIPGTNNVCSTCLGAITASLPPTADTGMSYAKEMSITKVQAIMSIKHVLASIGLSDVMVDLVLGNVFRVIKNRVSLIKSGIANSSKVILTMPIEQLVNITDVTSVDNVKSLSTARTTKVKEFLLTIKGVRKTTEIPIKLNNNVNTAMCSYEMLQYIKDNYNDPDIISADNKNYTIDITKFPNKPMFTLSTRTETFGDVTIAIQNIFERKGDVAHTIDKYDIGDTLIRLVKLIAKGSGMNIGAIGLLLSAYICKEGTTELGQGLGNTYHGQLGPVVRGRSLSVRLMYTTQSKPFTAPQHYTIDARNDSSLDVIFDPVRVLQHKGIIK